MTNFPTSLPGQPTNLDNTTAVASSIPNNQNAEINAIGAKVGIDGSANQNSHDYKLSGLTGSEKAASDADVIAALATAAANLASHAADTAVHGVAQVAGIADIVAHSILTSTHGVSQIAGLAENQTFSGVKTFSAAPKFTFGTPAAGDLFFSAANGEITRLALGALSSFLRVNAAGTGLEFGKVFSFGESTHDISVTGVQHLTGCPFKPSGVIIFGSFTGGLKPQFSLGIGNGVFQKCMSADHNGLMTFSSDLIVAWDTYPSVDGFVSSYTFTNDGVDLTWGKNLSPSGTFEFAYIFLP